MSKLISKLPNDIKIIALQRQKECKVRAYDKKTDGLIDAFDWSETIECFDIWDEVDEGNYKPFRKFHKNLKQKEPITPTSAIQKRIIKELSKGTKLSVRNMYLLRCSNISREIIRQFETPFGITLDREKILWHDEFGSGYYFEYSLNKKDVKEVKRLSKLCK